MTNFFVFLIYPRFKVTCLLPNNNYPNAIAMPTDFLWNYFKENKSKRAFTVREHKKKASIRKHQGNYEPVEWCFQAEYIWNVI